MIQSFNIDGVQHYSVGSVAKMIEEYIYRLKGARVQLRLKPGPKGAELYPEDEEKFLEAAKYALPAYLGGFKLKNNV